MKFGVALDDLAEYRRVRPLGCVAVGEVVFLDERRQLFQLVVLAGVVESFEVTEAPWLGARRSSVAALSFFSRQTGVLEPITQSARLLGMPSAGRASEARNSRIDERSTARPSPIRE